MNVTLPSPARALVVGTSAAGKSTFARQLAAAAALPLVQLDPLFWDRDWTPKPKEAFVRLVESATSQPEWVVDGNYGSVREQLWPKANVVIWLNYSLPVVFWRGLKRTVLRAATRRSFGTATENRFAGHSCPANPS